VGLGNNRDYVTRDRNIRRKFAVVKARGLELEAEGVESPNFRAMEELKEGKLDDRLKAWVDPILVHRRKMKALRSETK